MVTQRLVLHEAQLPVVRDRYLRLTQHEAVIGGIVLEVQRTLTPPAPLSNVIPPSSAGTTPECPRPRAQQQATARRRRTARRGPQSAGLRAATHTLLARQDRATSVEDWDGVQRRRHVFVRLAAKETLVSVGHLVPHRLVFGVVGREEHVRGLDALLDNWLHEQRVTQ
ncbi:hypothetical protein GQ600_20212 [Phytophthora cactorum]|nr:hypothetical protein GQ600_20212 [Phytophthora cactorum]